MKKFLVLFFSIALCAVLHAQAAPVANNTPGFIKKAADLGPVDPNTVITATAWSIFITRHNWTRSSRPHKKGSPNYHKWITQDQFNASFGPTSQEANSVQNFLSSHGLTVLAVAENNMYVKVEGTVAAIQKAFHVQIDSYKFKGNTYRC